MVSLPHFFAILIGFMSCLRCFALTSHIARGQERLRAVQPSQQMPTGREQALQQAEAGIGRKGFDEDASPANLHTKILDFEGFDSNIILRLKGGILMSIGISPESSSQGILVGII